MSEEPGFTTIRGPEGEFRSKLSPTQCAANKWMAGAETIQRALQQSEADTKRLDLAKSKRWNDAVAYHQDAKEAPRSHRRGHEAMSWVFTFRVDPPTGVVSARNGASVFFAAFSRALRQWYMVPPGQPEEKIAEPQMIFVSQEYADTHKRESVGRRPGVRLREGKQKLVQFELGL